MKTTELFAFSNGSINLGKRPQSYTTGEPKGHEKIGDTVRPEHGPLPWADFPQPVSRVTALQKGQRVV